MQYQKKYYKFRCKYEGCPNKTSKENKTGYCREHYLCEVFRPKIAFDRAWRLASQPSPRICKHEGCVRRIQSNNKSGYCGTHFLERAEVERKQWVKELEQSGKLSYTEEGRYCIVIYDKDRLIPDQAFHEWWTKRRELQKQP